MQIVCQVQKCFVYGPQLIYAYLEPLFKIFGGVDRHPIKELAGHISGADGITNMAVLHHDSEGVVGILVRNIIQPCLN